MWFTKQPFLFCVLLSFGPGLWTLLAPAPRRFAINSLQLCKSTLACGRMTISKSRVVLKIPLTCYIATVYLCSACFCYQAYQLYWAALPVRLAIQPDVAQNLIRLTLWSLRSQAIFVFIIPYAMPGYAFSSPLHDGELAEFPSKYFCRQAYSGWSRPCSCFFFSGW